MAFSDRFPTPYGVKLEGGSFVAEFPETARDAGIYNKMLDAWLTCAKEKEEYINRVCDLVSKLENDIEKECLHSSRVSKTLELRTKKLDDAVGLLQSIYTVLLLGQGQSSHPLNRFKAEIQELLESGDL